jgi:hypothetical protein
MVIGGTGVTYSKILEQRKQRKEILKIPNLEKKHF